VTGAAVVMPAFNEAQTIRAIAQRVLAQPIDRLIVVDDGSTDATAAALADLDLDLLTHHVNQGKGMSLLHGLRHAHGLGHSAIMTIDADGQHRPEDIPRLLEQATRSPNRIVIAARTEGRAKAPALRRFGNVFADFWISWACAQRVQDSQSGFRLYPGALFDQLVTTARHDAGFVFESEILIDAAALGFGSIGIPIETVYDTHARRSHYRPLRDTLSIVRMVAAKLYQRGFTPSGLWRSLQPLQQDLPGSADGAFHPFSNRATRE
jgi:glycosyltransferase involved in cell wall biosynthesis